MSPNWLPVFYYLLLWGGARARGTYRRWHQPLLRGPEWFFNVRVQPDFYAGPGRKILQRYRMRIFVSYLIEVPLTIAIFVSGHFIYLMWLILGIAAFTSSQWTWPRGRQDNLHFQRQSSPLPLSLYRSPAAAFATTAIPGWRRHSPCL